MNDASTCSLCHRSIATGEGFIVRIDIFADPETPPMTAADIAGSDMNATLSDVLKQIEKMSADDLQDGVHRRFEYRLCAGCQRSYLANPLGIPRRVPVGKN